MCWRLESRLDVPLVGALPIAFSHAERDRVWRSCRRMSASRAPARNPTNNIRSSAFIWSPTQSPLPASTRLQSVVRRSRVKLGPALRGNLTKLSPTLEYRQAQRPHFENVSNDEGIGSTETVMATGLANPTAYRRLSPTLPLSVRGRESSKNDTSPSGPVPPAG